MSKPFALTIGVLTMATLAAPTAFAQRDAGAKARGDMRPFWSSSNQNRMTRSNVRMPGIRIEQPVTQSYRSFSYVPASPSLKQGDEVIVNGEGVKMMQGKEELATVPNGTKFTVTKVVNGWLGADIEVDGKSHRGWIRSSDVSAAASTDVVSSPTVQESAEVVQAASPAEGVQEYRSFSYQPAANVERPSPSVKKHPWQYTKGDPRRYHP